MTTIKDLGGYDKALELCKELVLKDMPGQIGSWHGERFDITPEEHFENIIQWCKNNMTSKIWSHQPSAKHQCDTSYGAKHKCERELKCYVANNWMKLAMIYAGLEVCHVKNVDYNTGHVEKEPIQLCDILTNNQNFIYRFKKDNEIKYDCITEYCKYELKYRDGGYDE